jgi:hypothetical protein
MFSVELRILKGQLKSRGEEGEKLRKKRTGADEGLEESVLVANDVHAGNLADPLVGRDICKMIVGEEAIPPEEESVWVIGGLGTLETLKSFTLNGRSNLVDVDFVARRQHESRVQWNDRVLRYSNGDSES